jgi:hypothetical protein
MAELAMRAIEIALSSLATGLNTWSMEFDLLDDLIDAQTNGELHRLDQFTRLRDACTSDAHVVVGSTVTLIRRSTRETFCVAIGVTTAPPLGSNSNLLSWQFGFWSNAAEHNGTFVSQVFALPADAGSFIVLEELRPAAAASLYLFISEASVTGRAFMSYVHEDAAAIDRLSKDLGRHGVATWKDRDDLKPGERWKDAIRTAIKEGSGFIACLSSAYESKSRTYMNEELSLAVEELRLRPRNRSWFFPVLLDDIDIPLIPIGPGETLRDLQAVSLASDWSIGVRRLARVIRSSP